MTPSGPGGFRPLDFQLKSKIEKCHQLVMLLTDKNNITIIALNSFFVTYLFKKTERLCKIFFRNSKSKIDFHDSKMHFQNK